MVQSMVPEPAATQLPEDNETLAFKVAEVAIHDIFGLQESAPQTLRLEGHSATTPSIASKRTLDPAICQVLERKFEACNPRKNDFSALGPSSDINTALTKLVKILIHDFAEFREAILGETEKSSGCPALNQESAFRRAVAGRILKRIDADGSLCQTSRRIKAITAIAEAEMEAAYSKKISSALDNVTKEDFNRGSEDYRSQCQAFSRSSEDATIILSDPISRKLHSLRFAFRDFPYTENYVLMVISELAAMKHAGLQSPLRLPTRNVGSQNDFSKAYSKHFGSRSLGPESLEMEYVFCGSGPLPLSGILLHILTSSPVTLIDCSVEAVRLSRHLIESLARHGVVYSEMLRVVCSDAAAVLFRRPQYLKKFNVSQHPSGNGLRSKRGIPVTYDVLILASLLPNETKVEVARRARCDSEPGLMLIRSAMGLTSRLAYDEIPTHEITDSGWAFSGALIPSRELDSATGEHVGEREKRRRGGLRKLIGELDSTILNTVEFFC